MVTIFSTIGSNLVLKDRKLTLERLHPYLLIENEVKAQKSLYAALEPEKKGYTERRKAAFAASLPTWLRVVNDVRTYFINTGTYFHITNFSK